MRDLTKKKQKKSEHPKEDEENKYTIKQHEAQWKWTPTSLRLPAARLERLGNLSSSIKPTQHRITKAQNKTWNKQHFLSHILL